MSLWLLSLAGTKSFMMVAERCPSSMTVLHVALLGSLLSSLALNSAGGLRGCDRTCPGLALSPHEQPGEGVLGDMDLGLPGQ